MGVPRGLGATIARLQSCIQNGGRGKSRDVHIQGVNVGVGVPATGRLGDSRFKNRKRKPKIEKGKSKTVGKGTHMTEGNKLEQIWAAVNAVLAPEVCRGH